MALPKEVQVLLNQLHMRLVQTPEYLAVISADDHFLMTTGLLKKLVPSVSVSGYELREHRLVLFLEPIECSKLVDKVGWDEVNRLCQQGFLEFDNIGSQDE